MKRLTWLIANCHTVHIDANDHRSHYSTVAQEVEHDNLLPEGGRLFSDIDPDVLAECIKRNVLIELRVYPDTPVGFVTWYHYDFAPVLTAAWAWAVEERGAPADLSEAGP